MFTSEIKIFFLFLRQFDDKIDKFGNILNSSVDSKLEIIEN